MPAYCITGDMKYVRNGEIDRVIRGMGILTRLVNFLYMRFVGFEWEPFGEEKNKRLHEKADALNIGLEGGYTSRPCIHIRAETPSDAIAAVKRNKSIIECFFGYKINDPEKLEVRKTFLRLD